MSLADLMASDSSTPSGMTIASAVVAGAVTTAPVAVPAAWLGTYCRFVFIGASATDVMYIRFGTANTVAVATTASTLAGAATYALTEVGTEPHLVLPSGVAVDERIDKRWLFFAHISSAASGKLYVAAKTGVGIIGTSI